MMRWLVTGFGPFGDYRENPSQKLAQGCGHPHQVLDVGFRAVDAFVEELDPEQYDALLHLGVSQEAEKPTLELRARNHVGPVPDAFGVVWGPGPVSVRGPTQMAATLWQGPELWAESELWTTSVDAGCYLCNYLFYRSLERFPGLPVGFLHVPSESAMPLDEQHQRVQVLLERCATALHRVPRVRTMEYHPPR